MSVAQKPLMSLLETLDIKSCRNVLKWTREIKEKPLERIASPGMKRIEDQTGIEGQDGIWDIKACNDNKI